MTPVDLTDAPTDATPHRSVWRRSYIERLPWVVGAVFVLIHALLAVTVDQSDPGAFLRADRAEVRLQALLGLLASPQDEGLIHYLANHGIVGDYAAHALLYLLGGRVAIVAAQIALAVISGLCVYRLGILLGLSGRLSTLAMTIYLCLPHTFVYPHQLATEALHVPLFVISNWLLAKGVFERKLGTLALSAACLGIATLIRPITLLWPVVAAAAVAVALRPRDALIYACVAVLPVFAWMSFVGAQTGEFGLGKSSHSMERNLYDRVVRITATLPPSERDTARAAYLPGDEPSLGPIGYLRFSLAYPTAALRHVMHDATAFFGKSGVERITIDYLAVNSNAAVIQNPATGWRQQLELYGWPHTFGYLWQTLGPWLLVSLAGAAAIVMLFILALVGTLSFLKRWREIRSPAVLMGWVLASVVIYIFVFSQVLNAMQSRQRAPAEFAVALLAMVGLQLLRRRGKPSEQ